MRYGYARVSTRGQAREGTSLWDQEELLREAGCEKIYKEAYSGKTMERPEMEKLMESLQTGDEIYVTKLDRLARNTVEGIQFIDRILEKGCTIRIMNMGTFDKTPIGKLSRTMLLAFAEYEREQILERCAAGKERAREKEGWREGRPKTVDDERIRQMKEEGYTRKEIMDTLKISDASYYRALKRGA